MNSPSTSKIHPNPLHSLVFFGASSEPLKRPVASGGHVFVGVPFTPIRSTCLRMSASTWSLTARPPEKLPKPKRKVVFQLPTIIFSKDMYVKFQECTGIIGMSRLLFKKNLSFVSLLGKLRGPWSVGPAADPPGESVGILDEFSHPKDPGILW